MAISRARKEELVTEYQQQLEESNGVVMADYTALSVAQMQDLRSRAREENAQVYVVKNTLLELVLNERDLQVPEGLLLGPTVLAFCHKDVPPVAKAFREFSKEMEEGRFQVKGGLMEGRFLSVEETLAIADLPSHEVLLAQVLGTINAPATQMAGVVAGGIRQVLNVLQAYVDKLEESGGTSAEAAA